MLIARPMSDHPFLADLVALLHVAFVAFVLFGFILLLVGDLSGCQWSRNRGLRAAHLLAVIYTLGRTWLGAACPLRTLEDALRGGGRTPAAGIAAWSHRLFFRGADHRQFTLGVTLFSALVLAEMILSSRIPEKQLRLSH